MNTSTREPGFIETKPDDRRLQSLDGLRAFAFLAVFFHHALHVPMLWAGVDLFFVLSGFLITGILLRQKKEFGSYFGIFYYCRFLRIFTPYYLILLFTFLVLAPDFRSDWYWYVCYLSNFHDAFVGGGPRELTPMWSLAIEEQFYLLWPPVVYCVKPKRLFFLTVGLFLLAAFGRGVCTPLLERHWPIYYLLPFRMDLLAAGAGVAIVRYHVPIVWNRLAGFGGYCAAISLASFAIFAGIFPTFRTSAHSLLFNVLGYAIVCCGATGLVAYLVWTDQSLLARILRWRVLVYLGTISYMMYLCHQIIIDLVQKLSLSDALTAGIALPLVILLAATSWHWFEKPIQVCKNWYPRRASVAPASSPAGVE